MDRSRLLAELRARSTDAEYGRALNRLQAVLLPLDDLINLEGELPPAVRYLGPGIWLDAIREAAKK